jgi:glutamate/tyrosine decarboxylase-like PLP-dependent enzyme
MPKILSSQVDAFAERPLTGASVPGEDVLRAAQHHALSYLATVQDRNVYPDAAALERLRTFDEPLPQGRGDALDTIDMLAEVGGPATVASNAGRYFGFVVGGSLPVAMAADWLVSAWDQTATLALTSPAAAAIERVAGRWACELLGLPTEASVGFVTGASMGNLVGLAAARSHILRQLGHDVEAQGMHNTPPLRVVAGGEVHSTLFKVLAILGFGRDNVELVETDSQGRFRADRIPPLDERTIVLLQAGNVNSGAFDPFNEVCSAAHEVGAWVHVDGAFGLWAAASPHLSHHTAGVDNADSWLVGAHKWLNVPYDCSLVICRHAEAIGAAMRHSAAYAPPTGEAAPKDVVPEFSRRARGVPVWAALRTLGRAGVSELVERSCALARQLADGLEGIGFEVHNEVVLNQVVASIGTPEFTEAVREHVEKDGTCWFGPTSWQGRKAVRFSLSSWATTELDIERSLKSISKAVHELRADDSQQRR